MIRTSKRIKTHKQKQYAIICHIYVTESIYIMLSHTLTKHDTHTHYDPKRGKTWQDSDLVESVEIVKGAGRSLSCSRVQEGQAILVDMEREREGCGNRTLSIEF